MNLVKFSVVSAFIIFIYALFIFQQSISKTTSDKKDKKNIELEINTTALKPPVNSALYGMAVSNIFDRINVSNPSFIKFNQQLNLRVLRWPGGGECAYYHWNANGYGYVKSEIESINKVAAAKYEKQGRFKIQNKLTVRYIDQFIEMAKRTTSDVLLVGNILTATPNELLDQIRFFHKSGLKIIGVELGGEPYLNQLRSVFPSAQKYSSICIPFADSLKKYFPEIPIGACAAPYGKVFDDIESNGQDNFFTTWNNDLKKQNWYDAYIVHNYLPFSCQNTKKSPSEIFNCANGELNNNIDIYMNGAADYYLKTFGVSNKMWITEWNIAQGGTRGFYGNTLFQAMFIVEYFLKMNDLNYRHNNMIGIATYHNLDGGYIAAAAITNAHPDETYRDPESDTLIRRASFFAHLLIKELFNQKLRKAIINVSNNDVAVTDPNIHFEIYTSESGAESFIFFINKTGIDLNVNNIRLNGKSLNNAGIKISYLSGENSYAGFGKTNFFKQYKIALPCNWQNEKTVSTELLIPGYSVGYLKLSAN